MIVGGGVGFDVLCLLNVKSVILSVNRCSLCWSMVILTMFVLYGVYGGYFDFLVSLYVECTCIE